MRLIALAEIPGEWASALARWKVINAPHLAVEGNIRAPSATSEYMLYQALLGAWPLGEHGASFADRIQAYALKASREGKQETSWLNPNETYEAGRGLSSNAFWIRPSRPSFSIRWSRWRGGLRCWAH